MADAWGPARTGAAMSAIGALGVVVAVALPWLEVRAPGVRETASGLDADFDGKWLIAAAAAALVAVALRESGVPLLWPLEAADMALGIVVAVLAVGSWAEAQEELANVPTAIHARIGIGLYVTGLCAALLVVGSIVARQVPADIDGDE